MRKPVVYVAGPYRGPTEAQVFANILAAREAALGLWRAGFAPICPHLNSFFMGGAVTDSDFLQGDIEILARCDALLLLPNWNSSEGASGERNFAVREGIPLLVWERRKTDGTMRVVDAATGMEVRPADVPCRFRAGTTK